MKYIIYKMIQPEHLQVQGDDGYYRKTIYRDVLEKLDITGVQEEHANLELAMSEIVMQRDKLKHLKLTIIPVIEISWDGSIR